jgi:hypothetical protein
MRRTVLLTIVVCAGLAGLAAQENADGNLLLTYQRTNAYMEMESAAPHARGLGGMVSQHSTLQRGWTQKQILEAFEKGQSFPAVDKTAGFSPATRYVHPTTGKSVVINDATGKVIQVGAEDFQF